jgi:peptide/nickel transport system substrate-binding protein
VVTGVGTALADTRAHMTRLPNVLACAGLLLGLARCQPQADPGSSFAREETLYLGGQQWGEPNSFNPLVSSPDWPASGASGAYNLLYEPLLLFHPGSGAIAPWLAASYAVRDGAIEVVMDPAARWNDGRPLTGADVKYTFELGRTYKSLNVSSRWRYLKEVQLADEGRRVVFVLDPQRPNPLVVLDALHETPILPRHVIEPLLAANGGNLDEVLKLKFDRDPVGSGPYRLHSYSSEKIVLERHDGYWGNAARHGGKLPAPRFIVQLIYKSNDHFSVALQQGHIDGSSCFVPRIWLKERKGVRSWYGHEPFFVSASIITLIPNVTRKPLDDVRVRRAMAAAIDYRDIRELAVSGYSEAIVPGLVLPFGVEARYHAAEDGRLHAPAFDPDKARAVLREAGYRAVYDAHGELLETRGPDGKALPPMFIKSPAGWSDWESIVRIVVRSLRDVGLDVRERFVDDSLYYAAELGGDFDLIVDAPAPEPTPSQPWRRFEAMLTSEEWAPEGAKAYKNFGRFNNPHAPGYNPRIDALLRLIPTLADRRALADAYRELNVIFMEAQPAIPLVYRPDEFYEVSVRHWDHFPSAADPYAPAQLPGNRLGTLALWQLRPTSIQ